MNCSHCGADVTRARFCPSCGLPVHGQTGINRPQRDPEAEPITEPPSAVGFSHEPVGRPAAKRRRMWIVLAAALMVLLIGGGVAGGLYLNHKRDVAAAERAEERQREKEKQEAEAAQQAERQALYDACRSELSAFADDLAEVDARLDVGMSLNEYSDLVSDASVSYSRIDVDNLSGDCLTAGAKLESAFNQYSRAVDTWDDCVWDDWCDTDSIDPRLQRHWRKATDLISEAEGLVDDLDPGRDSTT